MNADLERVQGTPVHGDWLAEDELQALSPEKLISRMRALKPLLGANAREAEKIRKPVDRVWQAIRQSGALYHFVPKRFGGLEFDLDTFIDSMLPLGEGCASTAWVTAFCVEHNWMLAQFPERAQAEIFDSFPYITAPGVTAPPGKAVPVDGGYILSGRWKFATGVMNADWALAAGLVSDNGTPPTLLFCAVPIGQVRVIDTWHVDGMVGTGSNDIEIKNVFVPEYRTLDFAQMRLGGAPGARVHDNPIYRMPMLPFLALTAALPAIGNARAAVAFFGAQIKQRSMYGTSQKQEEKPAAQMRLARADIQTSVAELIVRDSARAIMNLARGGSAAAIDERISIRARIAYAMDLCRNAVRTICEASGAGSHFLDNPLQRARRDADMMASHIVYDLDGATELHGRALIGLPPNSPVV